MGLTVLTAVIVASIWITSQVPLYTATAVVLIEPPQELADTIDAEDAQDRYYRQQVDLLQSPEFATQVVIPLHLEANTAFRDMQTKRAGLGRLGAWLVVRLRVLLTYSAYLFGAPSSSPSRLPTVAAGDTGSSSDIVARYLTLLTVTSDPYSYSTEVSFTTIDPTLSQELADGHAAAFVQTAQKARFELTTVGREFLGQQLGVQESRLAQAEAALQQFHQEHKGVSPPRKDNPITQRLLDTHQRLTNARARRLEAEALYRLTERKDAPELVTIIKSDRVHQFRSVFTKLETEHTRLAAILAPSHPRLNELNTARNAARQHLEQEFASIVGKLESEYSAARNAETLLQQEVGEQQKKALEAGELEAVAAVLAADVTAARALTQDIGKQQQEGSIDKALPAPNIAITMPAELPLSPFSPQPKRDLVFAFLGGLITAIVLAFFAEQTDLSIRTAQDAWQATSYPLLGVIPPRASRLQALLQRSTQAQFARSSHADASAADTLPPRATIGTVDTTSLLAESYQSLSEALPLGKKKSPRTILFTSPRSGEGKTTTVLNLAITLAWNGHNVVLVDADLRTGRCHTLLRREQSPGLSDVLLQGASLSSSRHRPKKKETEENRTEAETSSSEHPSEYPQGEESHEQQKMSHAQQLKALVDTAIQTTTISGLSFMACGQVWSDPGEQLVSRTLPEVLSLLRRQFDCVLVDSPAATLYGDADLLSQLCDTTIIVVRGHKTPMAAAHRVAGQLQAIRANVLGVVLTNIHPHGVNLDDYR